MIALVALVGLPAAPAAEQSQALRIAWWTDVGFPTPFAFSTLGPGGVVRLSLIYDTLVWKDARGVIPWLADAWRTSDGGRAYVLTLHPDVRWQDGLPLTARDVRFSFEYYRRHPFAWADTSMVQRVEVRDRRTVVIRLAEPYAPFLENVAGVVPIIPEHVWTGIDRPEREQALPMAMGSGPYRLAEYRPESGLYRFTAFDGYFRGRPVIQEIQYLLVPAERQVLAVQNGQVDVAMATTYDVEQVFAGHPYIAVAQTEPLSIARLVFNLDRPPTRARPFRQAVAFAIDRARLGELLTRGPAPAGSPGIVPPTDPWYSNRIQQYPYDLARARSLLRSLGYDDRDGDGWVEDARGDRLIVELVSSPVRDVQVIQQMLADAGIEVRVRTVDPATRAELAADGRYQMLYSTHIGSGGDPDYLRTWFTGIDSNQFAAGSTVRSPEFLRLARLQLRAATPAARRETVAQMQQYLSRELPTLPLYYRRFFWMYDRRKVTPVITRGGLMNGIPLIENKLAFLPRR